VSPSAVIRFAPPKLPQQKILFDLRFLYIEIQGFPETFFQGFATLEKRVKKGQFARERGRSHGREKGEASRVTVWLTGGKKSRKAEKGKEMGERRK
jgi:hypothetical protein